MNKSYRSIWCEKTGTFVAAAETSRAKGKKPSSGVVATAIASAVGVAAFMAPQMALALTHGSSLVLCNQSANSAGGYSWGPGGTSKQVGCGPGSNPFGDGTQSFQLGNAGNDSGAANGEAQTAYVAGFSDGTLVLGGTNGVHVRSEMDLDNNKITNLRQGAVSATSKDAINGSQLYATNQSIADLDDRVTNVYEKGTKYFHANSTGTDSSALGKDSVAIGMGAVSNNANDVALGAGSMTSAAVSQSGTSIRGTNYFFAGSNPTGTVSVGSVGKERTITNVAAGRLSATSTDAVNGSQLYATNQAIEQLSQNGAGGGTDALAVHYDNAAKGTVTLGGDSNGTKIKNVAAGDLSSTSKDAVNGSQLYATNLQVGQNTTSITNLNEKGTKYFHANSTGADSSATGPDAVAIGVGTVSAGYYATAVGPYAKASELDATALGPWANALGSKSTAIGFNTNATGAAAVALGDTAGATGEFSLALGARAAATQANSVALGADSTTSAAVSPSGTSIRGTNYFFAGSNPTGTVSVGSAGKERTITNVAAGRLSATSTDAVNGSQLYATNQAIEQISQNGAGGGTDALAVHYDDAAKGTITLGGDNNGTKIKNVAAGDLSPTSKDAVNGSQLYATNLQVGQNTTSITNLNEKGTKYFHANSTGTDSSATGQDAVAIGMAAESAGGYATAVGSFAKASELDATALGPWANALGSKSTAIGFNTNATGAAAVALGDTAGATGEFSLALGARAAATQANSVALGADSTT
ncbi:ESPR-type extended signal peptide-containing protein, partial [Paraburkholderia sp. BR14374]|uniref:ESPR-type extended signal peptide-containing protein n=1 Tax=Paraburkholderia sp. BR14374 TaxID=3237007 RepID=UPI0034CD1A55